ncbi:Mlp family lipoprotein (plasmid) [Borrelia miyamotoi]|uniref:Mlp family lipoprotein n=2 Tax=Borrelia miyamotoi TaxID=47466 RepID=A0AAQ3CMZ0_9SPIR|nr:Mlp family lipoprotein [Borrelia miyamotoi]AHH05865.1 Mlp lipoprotein family protein [Borrelia miyamotoi FR64b]ATQ15569.1 Mlp family lipoprotein [Borrelia miyamotoi]ATQ16590.1 Mlp family lipoprotein [Borrelia miyamotoi]ATQ17763.1 Mlp family lipoprotein [Borrelia miyamotoi]ATQ18983.1 Mlp family lipoprotein [Borrelia miyamotoi]
MRRINFVLILSLLISSCGQYENANNVSKRRSKRDVKQQIEEVKKTPEEELREKLSEEEKGNLDFLKEALGDDGKFGKFLSLDEGRVKSALEHIKTQVEKCNGNDDGKKTFKTVVQGYFNTMDENTLDGFKNGATSTCGVGG